MEKNEITLSFDSEKMEALVFYLKKENTTVQKKMDEARLFYEQTVPEPLREYLDAKSAPARPKRPSRPSQPKPDAPRQTSALTNQGKEDTV